MDVNVTKNYIESLGRKCVLLKGNIKDPMFSRYIAQCTVELFGKIDILVNHVEVKFTQKS